MSRMYRYSKLTAQLNFALSLMMVSIVSVAAEQPNNEPYLAQNRVSYIEKVLMAFRETKLQHIINTYRYINVVERNNCRSTLSDLKVQCLLSFARKNCSALNSEKRRDNCALYSDIVVVNKLSEHAFIDRYERYHVTRNSGDDFRAALTNRLQQKYGSLVTDFSLTPWSDCEKDNTKCLAAGLDQFCLDYTNSKSLSWQYCVSASLWIIGTSR